MKFQMSFQQIWIHSKYLWNKSKIRFYWVFKKKIRKNSNKSIRIKSRLKIICKNLKFIMKEIRYYSKSKLKWNWKNKKKLTSLWIIPIRINIKIRNLQINMLTPNNLIINVGKFYIYNQNTRLNMKKLSFYLKLLVMILRGLLNYIMIIYRTKILLIKIKKALFRIIIK